MTEEPLATIQPKVESRILQRLSTKIRWDKTLKRTFASLYLQGTGSMIELAPREH